MLHHSHINCSRFGRTEIDIFILREIVGAPLGIIRRHDEGNTSTLTTSNSPIVASVESLPENFHPPGKVSFIEHGRLGILLQPAFIVIAADMDGDEEDLVG